MSASSSVPAARGIVVGTSALSRVLIVRGVVAAVFGLIALSWPQMTALALALLFGVYALLNGIGSIVVAFRHRGWSQRVLPLLAGLVGIAAGVVAWVWPETTVLALAILVGAWAVVTGLFEIVAAVQLRKLIRGEVVLGVAGALTVVAGVLILLWPLEGAAGIAFVIGLYALVYGVLLVVVGYRVRQLVRRLGP